MKIFSVDQKKCIRCNKCVTICPPRLFKVEIDKVINYADPYGRCIKCGHCVSVCPSEAIFFESSSELTRMPEAIPDIHLTMNLLHSKRSLRTYSNKNIQKPAIEEILKAMTCAPSGTNARSCDFIVITNNEIKRGLQDATVKTLKAIKALMNIHWLLKPFVSEKMYKIISSKHSRVGLDAMLKDINSGDDRIFFNAPVIIVGHTPASGDIALVDSTIAFTYGMLAGHALGIGSCWMGFTMLAVKKNRKIHKMLNIPKGRIIAGVITLGYPSIEYLSVPPRNERNVTFMDQE